jgi:hypothetical protein
VGGGCYGRGPRYLGREHGPRKGHPTGYYPRWSRQGGLEGFLFRRGAHCHALGS